MEDANLLLVFRPIRHEANEIHDGELEPSIISEHGSCVCGLGVEYSDGCCKIILVFIWCLDVLQPVLLICSMSSPSATSTEAISKKKFGLYIISSRQLLSLNSLN